MARESPADRTAAFSPERASAPRADASAAFCIASTSFFSSSLIASLSCARRLSFCDICVLRRATSVSRMRVFWGLGAAVCATRFISPSRASACSARRASVTSCRALCCSYFIVSTSIACSRSCNSATSCACDFPANCAAPASSPAPPETPPPPKSTASRMLLISRWFCLKSKSLSSSIVRRSSACFFSASERRSVIAACALISALFFSATSSCSRLTVLCATAVTCATADSSPALRAPPTPPSTLVAATCASSRRRNASRSSSAFFALSFACAISRSKCAAFASDSAALSFSARIASIC